MPNKMTDNEIIKAMRLCTSEHLGCEDGCPYTNSVCCRSDLLKEALDLINRQKAEIERLEKYHDDMEDAIYSFREDHAKVKFFKNEIKAEAVKEFAERLKALFPSYNEPYQYWEIYEGVDNILKEMVGDNDAD